jgi:hypothetical protein
MDSIFRPIVTRIGDIASRHIHQFLLGRAGHGVMQSLPSMPSISNYSGPAMNIAQSAVGQGIGVVKGALGAGNSVLNGAARAVPSGRSEES